jgi:hypothetical protein
MQPDSAPQTQQTKGFSSLLRTTVRLALSVADDRNPPVAAARESSFWGSTGADSVGGLISALSPETRAPDLTGAESALEAAVQGKRISLLEPQIKIRASEVSAI